MTPQQVAKAGVFHVSWQLARRGWTVLPTGPEARSTLLHVANPAGAGAIPIQSRALSKKAAVGLGATLDSARAPWWVVTVGVRLDAPVCYVLHWDEVRARASRDRGGDYLYRLEPGD